MMKTTTLGLLLLLICSCTGVRTVVWNLPEEKDNQKFAKVWMHQSDHPWVFPRHDMTDSLGRCIHVTNLRSTQGMSLDHYLSESKTLGFLIIRNDSILYEKYFRKYDKTRDFTSFSIAKSFVGTLVGIALDEGKIKSVNDPVYKYLPELDSVMFGKVTIKHLLNQCSGIHFAPLSELYYGRDLNRIIFKKLKVRFAPGSEFRYENGNTQLLGMILQRVTGKTLSAYMEEKIWKRIGTESDVYWSLDSKKHKTVKAFCCLNAKAQDYAKFGRLWLNRGVWDGEQIVPKTWVDDTYTRKGGKDNPFPRYKNQFWSDNQRGGTLFCAGLFGQYIYLFPDKHLILVKFGERNLRKHPYWAQFFGNVADQL